jgi:hypothetical protein
VAYQAASQYLSGTLKAGAMHQAVWWNEMNKSDLKKKKNSAGPRPELKIE